MRNDNYLTYFSFGEGRRVLDGRHLTLSRMAERKLHALSFNYLVVFVPLSHWPLHSIILLPKLHSREPLYPPSSAPSPLQHIKKRLINNINIFFSPLSLSCPDFFSAFCSPKWWLFFIKSARRQALFAVKGSPKSIALNCPLPLIASLSVCACVRAQERPPPLEPPEG